MEPASTKPHSLDEAPRAGSLEGSRSTLDPERWVDEYGDLLFRYALMKIRDVATAEDMVQETFLAAFRSRDNFLGKASEKTWLIGILKNKIFDYFRKKGREIELTDMESLQDLQDGLFQAKGLGKDCWVHAKGPKAWHQPSPEESYDQKEFWSVLQACCGKMPSSLSTVFLLREMDGLASEEICRNLNITPSNLWVMLHRARLALRQCLEKNWFNKQM